MTDGPAGGGGKFRSVISYAWLATAKRRPVLHPARANGWAA